MRSLERSVFASSRFLIHGLRGLRGFNPCNPRNARLILSEVRLFPARLSELRRVNRNVRFDLLQLCRISPVEPGELILKREFDAADIAIVGVIDLRGHAAGRRRTVANQSSKQTRLRIEIERGKKAPRAATLNDEVILIVDTSPQAGLPVGE